MVTLPKGLEPSGGYLREGGPSSRRPDAVNDVIRQLDVLIRARYPILYLVTWEEDRAMDILLTIARAQKKNIAVISIKP